MNPFGAQANHPDFGGLLLLLGFLLAVLAAVGIARVTRPPRRHALARLSAAWAWWVARMDQNTSPRFIRWFELLLLLAVAFGRHIIWAVSVSVWNLSWSPERTSADVGLIDTLLSDLLALALLGYVLYRQHRSAVDIGFAASWRDLPRALLLLVVTRLTFAVAYHVAQTTGASPNLDAQFASYRAGDWGIVVAVALVNPFYEELIVRAYTITEIRYLTGKAWPAIMVSVLIQGAYHLNQGVSATLAHCATFLVFSIYFARTGRIGPVILTHLAADVRWIAQVRLGQ